MGQGEDLPRKAYDAVDLALQVVLVVALIWLVAGGLAIGPASVLTLGFVLVVSGLRDLHRSEPASGWASIATSSGRALGGGAIFVGWGFVLLIQAVVRAISSTGH